MTTRLSLAAMVLVALTYSIWVTDALIHATDVAARELQLQLALTKRVEELARTRYGSINNAFACKLRPQ